LWWKKSPAPQGSFLADARRLLAMGRPPAWTLVVLPAAIVAASALSVLPPLFVGRMVDGLTHRDFPDVMRQLAFYAAVTVSCGLAQLADGYVSSIFRETFARNVRLGMVRKLDSVRFDALARLTPGEVINRVTSDVDAISMQLQYALFPTLLNLCTLVATIAAMAAVDVRLSGIAVVFALLTLLPLRLTARRIAALHRDQAESTDDVQSCMQEGATLAGLALLRNPHAGASRFARFEAIATSVAKYGIAQTLVAEGTGLASTLVNMLGPTAVLGIGAYLVARGQMTPGAIVTMLIYQARMSGPLGALSSLQVMVAVIGVVARRLFDVLDLPDERSGTAPFELGALRIRDVELQKDGRAVLRAVTLTIEPGAHVVVNGPSGSGKSTLATLLLRFYDPASGTISVGDKDLALFSLSSLRESVALVSQDPMVFDASLLENLTLTCPSAGPEDVAAALGICDLHEVVARLPDGMQTRLGQRGFRLSGGERQRLCLARAVLQQPKLLILDEALTGVDVEAEARILARLRAHFRNSTLLVVTHRLDSVSGFDGAVTMEDGRVVSSSLAVPA
jgi:ABC-type multidrug transport system fused ATPase/permease subunit